MNDICLHFIPAKTDLNLGLKWAMGSLQATLHKKNILYKMSKNISDSCIFTFNTSLADKETKTTKNKNLCGTSMQKIQTRKTFSHVYELRELQYVK